MSRDAAEPFVTEYRLQDDGTIPNNGSLPLLVYKHALPIESKDPASTFETTFARNGWLDSWRDGIYRHHHYHSTAHEVLGIAAGRATVQLGGENGITLEVEPGDVIVIPAGVGHKNLGSSEDFLVVGAYPEGQTADMKTGRASEHQKALESIARVPLPDADPVYGAGGPLTEYWRALP